MSTKLLQTDIQSLRGEIAVPGDKSVSHRSIMFGALAEGETVITNFLPGADCLSTIACFRKMGVSIEQNGKQVRVIGKGFNGLIEPNEVLRCRKFRNNYAFNDGYIGRTEFLSCLSR